MVNHRCFFSIRLYNKERVNEEVLNEVKKRLDEVKTTNLEDSGMLEELIEDSPYSPFPQLQNWCRCQEEETDHSLIARQMG